MRKIFFLLISLILVSCKSVEKSPCNSDFRSGMGLSPIEFTSEEEVYRIWIDHSSSVSEVITIYKDSEDYYGDYVEFGFKYPQRLLGLEKKVGVYKQTEICPVQGWANFMTAFQEGDCANLKSRKIRSNDGRMLHHAMTRYLVEIKRKNEVKRFEFFSFFPSPHYPDDMQAYKNLEKLMYTSFKPLTEKLRRNQDYHKSRFKYEY